MYKYKGNNQGKPVSLINSENPELVLEEYLFVIYSFIKLLTWKVYLYQFPGREEG